MSLFVALTIAIFVSVPPGSSTDDTVNKGILLFERGQYEEAEKTFKQAVAVNTADAAAQYYLGKTYFMLCDYDQAIVHLERAADLERNQADHYFWLGRAYGEKARRSGVLKQAALAAKIRAAFERAVALNPKHTEARTGLGNFYAQAPGIMGGGIDKATEQAKTLAALDPLKGALLSARIFEEQAKPDFAEATYRQLEERHGDSPDAFDVYGEYGQFLLRQGRIDDAIEILEKQTAIKPGSLAGHFNLAAAYTAADQSQKAAAEYARAAQINPKCKPPKKQYRKKGK